MREFMRKSAEANSASGVGTFAAWLHFGNQNPADVPSVDPANKHRRKTTCNTAYTP
jgi:hypothetical protein